MYVQAVKNKSDSNDSFSQGCRKTQSKTCNHH